MSRLLLLVQQNIYRNLLMYIQQRIGYIAAVKRRLMPANTANVCTTDCAIPRQNYYGGRVSVLIPVYNGATTIEQTITSVYSQTALSEIAEIIVVDDGSTDNTWAVLKNLQARYSQYLSPRIRLIYQPNQGVAAARNRAMRESRGDWLAFLDADDNWLPTKLRQQLTYTQQFDDIRIVGSATNVITSTQGDQIDEQLYLQSFHSFMMRSRVCPSTLMIHRSVMETCGVFDQSMARAEDMNYLMRIARRWGIYYIAAPLVQLADKPMYGFSGLSANLSGMHQGCMYNVSEAHRLGYINWPQMVLYHAWEMIRYGRRIAIVTIYKTKNWITKNITMLVRRSCS